MRRRRVAARRRAYLAGGIVATVLMLGLISLSGGPRSIAYQALRSVGLQTPLPVLGSGGGGPTAAGPTPTAGAGGESPRATVPIARRTAQPGDPGQQTPQATPTPAGQPTSSPSNPSGGGGTVIAGPRSTPTPEATSPPVESTPTPAAPTPEPSPTPSPGLCLLNLICIY